MTVISSPYGQPLGSGRLHAMLCRVRLVAFDFDGVFTDNFVYVAQDGLESVRCWRSDGIGLTRLRAAGVHVVIVSTEANPIVTARANKLRVACKQGIDDKAAAILATCAELGVEPVDAAFVGNDINDVPAFKAVGLPVAVADAYAEVFSHVRYRTSKAGGHGAVREVCDLIFHAKQGVLAGQETGVG